MLNNLFSAARLPKELWFTTLDTSKFSKSNMVIFYTNFDRDDAKDIQGLPVRLAAEGLLTQYYHMRKWTLESIESNIHEVQYNPFKNIPEHIRSTVLDESINSNDWVSRVITSTDYMSVKKDIVVRSILIHTDDTPTVRAIQDILIPNPNQVWILKLAAIFFSFASNYDMFRLAHPVMAPKGIPSDPSKLNKFTENYKEGYRHVTIISQLPASIDINSDDSDKPLKTSPVTPEIQPNTDHEDIMKQLYAHEPADDKTITPSFTFISDLFDNTTDKN